jgi:hypothetical protein
MEKFLPLSSFPGYALNRKSLCTKQGKPLIEAKAPAGLTGSDVPSSLTR